MLLLFLQGVSSESVLRFHLNLLLARKRWAWPRKGHLLERLWCSTGLVLCVEKVGKCRNKNVRVEHLEWC